MKKHIRLNLFGIVLIGLLVGLVYVVRITAEKMLVDLKSYLPELNQIQQELIASNLTAEVNTAVIDSASRLSYYALGLYMIVLPLGIYLLFLIFEGLAWKELRNVSWKRIALLNLVNAFAFLIFVLAFLDFLSYFSFGVGWVNGWILLLVSVLVSIVLYFNFVAFCRSYNLRNVFVHGLNKLRRTWHWFVLFLICSFLLVLLVGLIYVFIVLSVSLIILIILSLVFVVLTNLLRMKLFKVLK